MRLLLLIFLLELSFVAYSQKINFKNDSLFINDFYVDGYTNKTTLDRLLNSNGKQKKKTGKYKPGTKQISNLVSYTYKKLGLIFTKNDDEISTLSIAVKLYRNTTPSIDHSNMPTNTFGGELFIAENYMNDKRQIAQLEKLKNCTVTFKQWNSSSQAVVISCDIIYQERPIRLLFDAASHKMTCIFIH